ncbi:MAG: hypothetical protein D6755_06675 [Anaerolineae bacterium]|nr:MAG: hypothetical protein D6755_06675 [Anaerolineae bacterium]
MAAEKRFSLVKPTLDTPFHIDFEWWSRSEHNWRVHLMSYLAPEHQQVLANNENETFDTVDPETAEVTQVEALQYLLMAHYARQDTFLSESTSLVETIFRLFLINGNRPLTPREIGERLHRPPSTILRTLSGRRVYRGLRPYLGATE